MFYFIHLSVSFDFPLFVKCTRSMLGLQQLVVGIGAGWGIVEIGEREKGGGGLKRIADWRREGKVVKDGYRGSIVCLLHDAGIVIVSCGQGCGKILTVLSTFYTPLLLYLSVLVVPSYSPSLSLAQSLSLSLSLSLLSSLLPNSPPLSLSFPNTPACPNAFH